MVTVLITVRQSKFEKKKDFLAKIDEYELAGYEIKHSYCYDRINQLAEVTLALKGTYNKAEYTESLGQFSINNNINNDGDSNDRNGGYLN